MQIWIFQRHLILNLPAENILAGLAAMSAWEAIAMIMAIVYLWLAIRQNIWCWAAALISTTIYTFVMYGAGLYMESALQIFYIALAVYGWHSWRQGSRSGESGLAVSTWRARHHFFTVGCILLLAIGSGLLLSQFTVAALPYLDSFTTWGAIAATYMVARKILENWLYWFVIDSVSVYLYVSRGLYLTAVLFLIYLVMIVFGYRVWRRSMAEASV
jgi:nicotinamide mononucleotide transporter